MENVGVLVVDDEEDIGDLLTDFFLEYFKIKPEHLFFVKTVADAKNIIKTKKINLVLLDFHLGTHSGVDLLADLQELNPRPQTILMSGNLLKDQYTGVDNYLVKPFRFEALKNLIKKI
jgi:response regulator of citrate/malate metabolism